MAKCSTEGKVLGLGGRNKIVAMW